MSLLALAVSFLSPQAPTCEPAWLPTFGTFPGADGPVYVLAALDAGDGTALYAGGSFLHVGELRARRVARFDGAKWSALGDPDVAAVRAFAAHGGELYGGGGLTSSSQPWIGRWDGSAWHAIGGLGATGQIHALASYDDGSGAALYAAGPFTLAGGASIGGIARWDGHTWSPVGTGLVNTVNALAVHDDGSGPALYAAGSFTTGQGAPASHVARWNGTTWSGVGASMSGGSSGAVTIHSLALGEFGAGRELVAGGSFTSIGGEAMLGVARWDGSTWQSLAYPQFGGVRSVVFQPLANGTFLHVAAMTSSTTATWHFDGSTWSAGVLPGPMSLSSANVSTIAAFGDTIYKGGSFAASGSAAAVNLARFEGNSWQPLFHGANGGVNDIVEWDDGSGPALFVAGSFSTPGGGVVGRGIARFGGDAWSSLPGFVGSIHRVNGLAVHDDGSGSALYAAGEFLVNGAMNVARYDGTTWAALGAGLYSHYGHGASCLMSFDDGAGPTLFAGGGFQTAGSTSANGLARWDGQAWKALQPGLVFHAHSMTVFDDGTGPKLHVADDTRVGRWNGSFLSLLGTPPSPIRALGSFGSGVTGRLAVGSDHVAAWDGSAWTPLGSGGPANVWSLQRTQQFGGEILLAAGTSQGKFGISRWDGTSWAAFAQGAAFEDGYHSFSNEGPLNVMWAGDFLGKSTLIAGGNYWRNTHSGDGRLSIWTCPEPGAFVHVPGCAANPNQLTGQGVLALGKEFGFTLESPPVPRGFALLYAGDRASDASGCGVPLPGTGELLLASTPLLLLDVESLHAHAANFAFVAPTSTALVGIDVTFQAAVLAAGPWLPLTLSNAVRASIGP